MWLKEIGFADATEVFGGVAAWLAAGLPLEPYQNGGPPAATPQWS